MKDSKIELKEELKQTIKEISEVIKDSQLLNSVTNIDSIHERLKAIPNELQNLLNTINNVCKTAQAINLNIDSDCQDIKRKIDDTIRFLREGIQEVQLEQIINFITQKDIPRRLLDLADNVEDFKQKVDNQITQSDKIFTNGNELKTIDDNLGRIKNITGNLEIEARELRRFILTNNSRTQIVTKLDVGLIATRLYETVNNAGQLWVQNILNRITGFEGVHAELSADEIQLCYENTGDCENEKYTTKIIFSRYRPYEPIAERKEINNVEVYGNYTWFIEAQNAQIINLINHNQANIKCIEEDKQFEYYDIKIRKVILLNTLKTPIQVRINDENEKSSNYRVVRIKYGSDKLASLIKGNLGSKIQEIYENDMKKQLNPRVIYKATDLSYVWYCYLGLGISTDPWDYKCPFVNDCKFGKYNSHKIKGCKWWSGSRKIFPKIFSITDYKIYPEENPPFKKLDEQRYGILIPIFGKRIHMDILHKGVQFSIQVLPSSGYIGGRNVKIKFARAVIENLPTTNVIGFAIPINILHNFIQNLLDSTVTPKPYIKSLEFLKNFPSVTLDNLLKSKFFLWKESNEGNNIFRIVQQNLLDKYREFMNELEKDDEKKKLEEFSIEALVHTLAHLFHTFISSKLGIDEDDLIYHYYKDSKFYYIIVAEHSPLGVLNIVDHASQKFGSFNQMLHNFIEDLKEKLGDEELKDITHLSEIINATKNESNEIKNRFQGTNLEKLGRIIEEYYDGLIKNGLILDEHIFSLHLLLHKDKQNKVLIDKFAEQSNVKREDIEDILLSLLTYAKIPYCLDGCTSCVIYDRNCKYQLAQNLALSRELVMVFLDVFFRSKKFSARGDDFLKTLIIELAHEEVFINSPYIDNKGVELIRELLKRNVKVTLLTNKTNMDFLKENLGDLIKNDHYSNLIKIYTYKLNTERHDKNYIIDDQLSINTSRNLTLNTSKIETFSIELIKNKEKAEMDKLQLISNSIEQKLWV